MSESPETRCRRCGRPVLRARHAITDRVAEYDRIPNAAGTWHLAVETAPATYPRGHDAGSSAFGVRHAAIETLVAIHDPRADVRYVPHSETCSNATLFGGDY